MYSDSSQYEIQTQMAFSSVQGDGKHEDKYVSHALGNIGNVVRNFSGI